MEKHSLPTLEETCWNDVKDKVKKVNPHFASMIDKIKPGKLPLFLARYPFGTTILNENNFYLSHNGKLLSIQDPSIPEDLKLSLGYNSGSVPLAVGLHNSVELYMQQDDRIIPFSVMSPGAVFGIWGALNRAHSASPKVWHITSGARSIFLLPSISDTPSYKKLAKARNLKIPVPKELIDQGPVLTEISKHPNFADGWYAEILFFPRIWLEEHPGEAWARFQLYLYTSAWEKTEYWRNKVVHDYIWDSFVKEFSKKNVRVSHYIFDIVEHLIMVALGVLPGFVVATDNTSAPVEALQHDFLNVYGLKYYVPAIIVPAYIQQTKSKAVYWSMQFATYFESLPRPKATNSIVSDLREIIYLVEEFQKAVLAGKITSIIGTPFFELMKKVKFEFFHSNITDDENIFHCNEMPKKDPAILEALCTCENKLFSEISPFARGCVRITIEDNAL